MCALAGWRKKDFVIRFSRGTLRISNPRSCFGWKKMQIETWRKKNEECCLLYNSRQIYCIQSLLVEVKGMVKGRDLELRISWGRLGGSVGWASDFGSGHDLTVRGSSPTSGFVLTAWRLLQILCLPRSLPLSCSAQSLSLSLSLSLKNKHKN